MTNSRIFIFGLTQLILLAAPLRSETSPVDQVAKLKEAVSHLPEATDAGNAKKAVLQVAVERAEQAFRVGKQEIGEALIKDIAAGLASSAAEMAQVNAQAKHVTALAKVPIKEGNPYLDLLVGNTRKELEAPDPAWLQGPFNEFPKEFYNIRDTRDTAEAVRTYIWLYANDASPLKGNPELLRRLLRRAHTFIDAYDAGGDPAKKVTPQIYDQFSSEQAIGGLCEFIALYPGMLLPSQRATWDHALRKTADLEWNGGAGIKPMKAAKAVNLNIETARMVAVLNLGYYIGDKEMVAKVFSHVDTVLSRMKPDGAFPYEGHGNPSCNYHDVLLNSLVRIYGLSGYEPIKQALIATQWKGPVAGRTDEFWTSLFSKSYRWNFAKGTESGNEAVAALSGNGYVRGLLDRDPIRPNRDQIEWYRNDVKPIPLPDNYTIPDRNVGGPRAWYGNFMYAGSFRSPPEDEVGLKTLMGAMTVDGSDGRVNSILVGVTPRVRILPADVANADGDVVDSAWAFLSTEMKSAVCVGKTFSACAADYTPTCQRLRASKGTVSDWRVQQMWIGFTDRIVGLVSLRPRKDGASAYGVESALRLISGGATGALVPKSLEKVSENAYRYGQLDVTVHSSNYPVCEARVIGYRRERYPATELTFAVSGTTDTKPEAKRYPLDTCLSFIVEVRPTWAQGEATIATQPTTDGILSLRATVGTRTILLLYNPTAEEKSLPAPGDLPKSVQTSVRFSSGESANPPESVLPAKVKLKPGEEAVYMASDNPLDHEPGWQSFQQMVSTAKKE